MLRPLGGGARSASACAGWLVGFRERKRVASEVSCLHDAGKGKGSGWRYVV